MRTDRDGLSLQVRVLEQALNSQEFRHNSLARAVFEARLMALRLDGIAVETPSAQPEVLHRRLMRYANAQARPQVGPLAGRAWRPQSQHWADHVLEHRRFAGVR